MTGFGPTLPISNVRYHGEYRGYSGRAADSRHRPDLEIEAERRAEDKEGLHA
jgi:hypothetical protein